MAALDTGARRHPSSIFSCFALLIFIATLFLFSALRRSFSPEGLSGGVLPPAVNRNVAGGSLCNYTSGKWIRDQSSIIPRYDSSCKEIFKGWNCISSGKSNARDLLQWRWKPLGCDLLPLDPVYVLRRFRNKSIGK